MVFIESSDLTWEGPRLKDRKGRALTLEDRKHYQRIIIALMKTAAAAEMLDASWGEGRGVV